MDHIAPSRLHLLDNKRKPKPAPDKTSNPINPAEDGKKNVTPRCKLDHLEAPRLSRQPPIRPFVTNTGRAIVPRSDAGGVTGISCGDRVERCYHAGWRVVEETDNATTPRTLAQTVWGTEYIDEPVCRDRNTNVATNSDCLDSGGLLRYFYHQDASFRVCSLTSESGAVVERYEYDAYGEPRVFGGVASTGAEGAAPPAFSGVGNPYLHQSLRRDDESRPDSTSKSCAATPPANHAPPVVSAQEPANFRESSGSWQTNVPTALCTRRPPRASHLSSMA